MQKLCLTLSCHSELHRTDTETRVDNEPLVSAVQWSEDGQLAGSIEATSPSTEV